MEQLLNRVRTIFNPKPDSHTQLLEAFKSRDLKTFKKILQRPGVSTDHWYDEPHQGTCLHLVAKEDDGAPFAAALIESGAQVNICKSIRGEYPIHVAARYGQDEILKVLLSAPYIDVNALDSDGDTPLHIIAIYNVESHVDRYKHCIQLLMKHPEIDPNLTNNEGYTVLQWAARFGSKEFLRTIVDSARVDLDVDSSTTLLETAREIIDEKYPEMAGILLQTQENQKSALNVNNLFQHLYRKEEELFISALDSFKGKELLEKGDGSYTLLQYTSKHGLFWAAKALLQKGAKCHSTCENQQRSPALLACYGGYANILRLLISHDVHSVNLRGVKCEGTALHVIFNVPQVYRNSKERHYKECLDIILQNLSELDLKINSTDSMGNTALHYAAKYGDEHAVNVLLQHGAYIGVKNNRGCSPLVHMSAQMLEAFLNDCLSTNDRFSREDLFEITFSYVFFVPPQSEIRCEEISSGVAQPMPSHSSYEQIRLADNYESGLGSVTTGTETELLLYISKSRDLKHLLKHPIFTSFLDLKWQRIRVFFYINLVLYIIFVALLTVHIIYNYRDTNAHDTTMALATKNETGATPELDLTAEVKIPITHNSSVSLWTLLIIFLMLLTLRETFQFIASPKVYLKNPRNYLELVLCVVTGAILFSTWVHDNAKAQFSAVAILLSWAVLALLVGRHPHLSTNTEIFKRVLLNYLKFLSWYGILIFGFGLCFYTLFLHCGGAIDCDTKRDSENNPFSNPRNSIFKTIVMFGGEYEASSIPFVSSPFTSHIIFVLFVFLIAVHGLAVSDTEAIREDAEVVSCVHRVKLISYMETMFHGSYIPFSESLKRWCCCWPAGGRFLNSIASRVRLFPNTIPDNRISVFPNLGGRIRFPDQTYSRGEVESFTESPCLLGCRTFSVNPMIVKKAMEILDSRGKISEMEEMKQKLEEYEWKLQEILSALTRLESIVSGEHLK